jgi:hypothetical protein
MAALEIFLIIFFVTLLGVGAFFWFRLQIKKKINTRLGLKLFSIRLPPGKKEGAEIIKEIAKSEQFFSSLASLNSPVILEAAIPSVGKNIHFYVAVQSKSADPVLGQLHAIWPEAEILPAEDYNLFHPGGVNLGAVLTQKEFWGLPVRTYKEIQADSFQTILGGLENVDELGEGAAIQVVIKAASEKSKLGRKILEKVKRGESLQTALVDQEWHSLHKDFANAILGKGGENLEQVKNSETKKPDTVLQEALENKLNKPILQVNFRILASAPSESQARGILEGTVSGLEQFSSPGKNSFRLILPKNISALAEEFIFRDANNSQAVYLTGEELAGIFHLPTPFTEISNLARLNYRTVAAPVDLPSEGILLGWNEFRSARRAVRLAREDRRRHFYIIGQTGTGKSALLSFMVGQDMERGEGVGVLDPNGDLFMDLLGRLPENRAKDAVVFDPSDLERPVGLNMLEYDPAFPEQKTFIVNEMLSIFDSLYDMKTTGGPMFEQYLRNTLQLLMDDPSEGATIVDVPRVLSDTIYRKRLLAKCQNALVKNFWEKEAEKAGGEAALANLVPYITSKFNTFIANDYVRPIISQSKSTLNFREIMDGKKILLANLSKGKIGELNASLLGMLLVGKLTLAAFARADQPEASRADFYLYLDEFQNFTTPTISMILSEARKYRLNLNLAHQFIAQLKDNIREAVFGNVGSICSFRIGPNDSDFLVKQFSPVFDAWNLVNIDNLRAHIKLLSHSKVLPPFTMSLELPPRGDLNHAKRMAEISRNIYGRPRAEVEAEMAKRLNN